MSEADIEQFYIVSTKGELDEGDIHELTIQTCLLQSLTLKASTRNGSS